MPDQERRRAARQRCDNRWINVSPQRPSPSTAGSPFIKVEVENVSVSGVCLLSSTPFLLGQVLLFAEDDMPDEGTVVWTYQSKTKCKAGVQFARRQS